MDKIVILSDHQARYTDRLTWRAVLKFLGDFQPNVIVNAGDLFDLEALSSFPKTLEARASVEKDLRAGRALVKSEMVVCPHAHVVLVEGNHEARVWRYLQDNAPEMRSVVPVKEFLLGPLADGVQYVGPYGAGYEWHTLLIPHGAHVSKRSAYSAHAELEEAGTSGVSGHTHRLGSTYFTDREETHAWYENGCLCYIRGPHVPPSVRGPRVQDWQQGFSVGYYEGGVWNVYQVSVTRHRFIWEGKTYAP